MKPRPATQRTTLGLTYSATTEPARTPRAEESTRAAADAANPMGRIGDCYGPSLIAAATYEGHRYARELDTDIDIDVVPFKREPHQLELA